MSVIKRAEIYLAKKLKQSNMERYNPANCLISDLTEELSQTQKELQGYKDVVEAAKFLDKLKTIKSVRGKTKYYLEHKADGWLSLSVALSKLNK